MLHYESSEGPPPQNEYLVCLLSIPDCEFSVRCVTIEFQPSFSASATDQEPEEHVFDSLIREAQRVEKRGDAVIAGRRGTWPQSPAEGGSGSGGASGAAGGASGAGGASAASGGSFSGTT